MKLAYTSDERLQTIFKLNKAIKELKEVQCTLSRKANENKLDEIVLKECYDSIQQLINTKTWCILEHLDRLENEIKIEIED